MDFHSAMTAVSEVFSRLPAGRSAAGLAELHIIDQLILERAENLSRLPFWPMLRPIILKVFNYRTAVELADEVAAMTSHEMFSHISNVLQIDIDVDGFDNIPATGGFILASNHPTGLADGIAVFRMLQHHRPDMAIFGNRDALRVNPNLGDLIIPVEWRDREKSFSRSRDTLEITARAFRDERAIIMFPSGRLAYWNKDRLTERPWRNSVIALARRYDVPIIPAGITSRNSGLFYFLSKYSTELRDMMLFHELLNKKGKTVQVTIGQPIAAGDLPHDLDEATRWLREYTTSGLAGMAA
jgi:putative hemolysin